MNKIITLLIALAVFIYIISLIQFQVNTIQAIATIASLSNTTNELIKTLKDNDKK